VPVDHDLDDAVAVLERERGHVRRKREAYDSFREAVRGVAPSTGDVSPTARTDGGAATLAGPAASPSGEPGSDGCERVREAFADTVAASAADLDPAAPVRALRVELGEEVGVALATDAPGQFTPALKAAVLGETANRRSELVATGRALDREADSLSSARDRLDDVRDRMRALDDTPLSGLGFDALRERLDALAALRARCERVADDRQTVLAGTTSETATVDVHHRRMVEYLYDGAPATFPVLAAVGATVGTLAECERVVRAHLTRRA